jgi:hypothetical protein
MGLLRSIESELVEKEQEMEDYEKTQATLKLLTELAKGKKAGEEQGWLSVEDVKQDLGITHA